MPHEYQRLQDALADRYQIERELGHGGMATVYLAKDLRHDRVVAIKVLNPDLGLAVGGDRFLREIAIAAQLQHPHILTLIDSGEAGGYLYYVMPFVEGESLRSKLARDGALPPSEVTRLFREIVDALANAHKHGMVHRDIKPDNVMISNRHALVVDFGVAKAMKGAAQSGVTTAGTSLGTPAYMAPEQIAADPDIDGRADIYSAGVVAYEMLAGKPPFSGNAQQLMSAHMVTPPPPLAPTVPPAIARIVMKCLEKQRGDRYQSAEDLLTELESLATPTGSFPGSPTAARTFATKRIAAVVVAGVVIVAATTYALTSRGGEKWVRAEAIPQIQHYMEIGANDSAYVIAVKAAKEAPDDSLLKTLWPLFTRKFSFKTVPEGAKVYRAMYGDTTRWDLVGTTPLDSLPLPGGASVTRMKFELPGYSTVNRIVSWNQGSLYAQPIVLDKDNGPDADMVRIPGGKFDGALPGLDALKPIPMGDYYIDKYETKNSDYKKFMDAGGYSKPEYWEQPFVKDGRTLSFAEAMALFVDRTGRPGPSTWEAGDYPSGQGDFPVGGISWYEAAAYAKFAGKSLPTMYHWARAATVYMAAYIIPVSNFRRQGAERIGSVNNITGLGVYDMAGNVREWCFNEETGGRYILGGGWNDQTYQFNDAYTQPPFDRSPINGVRLVKYLNKEPGLELAMKPLARAHRDYSKEKPVSDAEFKTFVTMFDYDPLPLNAKVEARDSSLDYAYHEKITFAAAYGNERVTANLFLPKNRKPPYQVVVFFPGSNAIYSGKFTNTEVGRIDFLLKSGRALMFPIYKSTYERADSLQSDYADRSVFYRDHVLMWAKDLRRSIDYLETRGDIDSTRIGYFGVSWGGYLGGIMPAVEPRIKAVVLYVAGLAMDASRPEADVMNFLPRVKQPVIMLNGKYDHFFPVETAQKPFFQLLGTPADRKRYVLYDGGHFVPRTQLIQESLSWYDKYLGPVK